MFKNNKKNYREHELDDFLRLNIRKSIKNEFSTPEIYEKYTKWCIENNTIPKKKSELYSYLEARGFKKVKYKNGPYYFKGVKFK